MAVGDRNGIIVRIESHQRFAVGRRGDQFTGIEGRLGKNQAGDPVLTQEFTLGECLAAEPPRHIRTAALQKIRIQFGVIRHLRNRNHKVLTRISNRAFDDAFFISAAHPAKMRFEQVMTYQPSEADRQLAGVRPEDFSNGHPGVIVTDAFGREAEEAKGGHMSFEECFGAFPREGHHEHSVAVDHAHDEKGDLRQLPANTGQGVAEVHLGFARRLSQRHEHLLGSRLAQLPHGIPDRRISACEAFFAEQFPHSFDCVALLARLGFAFFEQFVNSPQPRANYGTVKLGHSLVTRRGRMSQNLLKGFEVNVKLTAGLPLGKPIDQYRAADLCPLLHVRVHSGCSCQIDIKREKSSQNTRSNRIRAKVLHSYAAHQRYILPPPFTGCG